MKVVDRAVHTLLWMLAFWCMAFCVCAQEVSTIDSAFLAGSRPINFKVNKTDISPADRQWIIETLIPTLQILGCKGIIIGRAAASPEGPHDNNRRLAEGRRRTADAILKQFGIDPSCIHYDVVTEDYELTRVLMAQAGDEYLPVVDSLMKVYGADTEALKEAMKREQGGTLWKRLLDRYFPQLRAVRIMPIDLTLHNIFTPLALPWRDREPQAEATQPLPLPELSLQPLLIAEPAADTARIHRIPFVSLRSNLLYDLFYMPNYGFAPMWNIGAEFYPRRGHLTYGIWFLSPYWHRWSKHKFFQIRNYEAEVRYYFRGTQRAEYLGWYLGVAGDLNKFGIGLNKDKGWQGEGYGAQLSGGYVMPIARHQQWKLHFHAGVGFYSTKYDPYVYGTPKAHGRYENGQYYYDTDRFTNTFQKRMHRYRWFGPTQIGISLSYDLLWRKGTNQSLPTGGGKSEGISFRRWQKTSHKARATY